MDATFCPITICGLQNRRLDVAQPGDDMNPNQVRFPSKGTAAINKFIAAGNCTTLGRNTSCGFAGDVKKHSFGARNSVESVGVQSVSVRRSVGHSLLDRSVDEKSELTHHNRLQYMHCNTPAERSAGGFRRFHGST